MFITIVNQDMKAMRELNPGKRAHCFPFRFPSHQRIIHVGRTLVCLHLFGAKTFWEIIPNVYARAATSIDILLTAD